jgi:hypothetical protein
MMLTDAEYVAGANPEDVDLLLAVRHLAQQGLALLESKDTIATLTAEVERLRDVEAELAALKARRCETCLWWDDQNDSALRRVCTRASDDNDSASVMADCLHAYLFTESDHYCAAHEPKEATDDAE